MIAEPTAHLVPPRANHSRFIASLTPLLIAVLSIPSFESTRLRAVEPGPNECVHRLVLIDGSLPGARELARGVTPGSRPVLLDPAHDLADQLLRASWDMARTGVTLDSVDFVMHGAEGQLKVGEFGIDAASIRHLVPALAPLSAQLRDQGSIRLYGCNVAQGESGRAFVLEFSRAMGVPVQASVNPTGSIRNGGDWTLEFTSQPVASPGTPPFLPGTLAGFDQTLALNAGDIAILRVEDNGSPVAQVKWAPLVDLPTGTSFVITDRSWINGQTFFPTLTAEGSVTITAQTTISAGEVFTLDISVPGSTTLKRDSDNSQSVATFSLSGWTGSLFTLTTAGDSLLIYDGADSSPNFIFGFLFTGVTVNRDPTTGWSTSTTAATTSLLPSSLTSGTTALSINNSSASIRHLAYNGLTSSATRAQWLSRIANAANWNSGTSSVTGSFTSLLPVQGPNTTPSFVGVTTSLTVSENASATSLTSLLHVSDTDSSQTLTWSQSSAPSHGTLNFSGATASSGSSDITPGGTITYTPTSGYIGSDSFAVQVSDGTATATRTITVTVQDVTSPTVSIGAPSASLTTSGPISYTVTYTDAHFSSATLNAGDITVNSTGSASAGSIGVTGSGNTRTVTLSSITGNGTLGISVASGTGADTSGNPAGAAGPSSTFSVDNTTPSIDSILRQDPSGSSTTLSTVQFRVAFSEAVSGVGTGDFELTTTDTAAGSIASISASSGTTFDVTVNSITGSGTLRLDLKSSGTGIQDDAGNAVSGGFNSGQTYSVSPPNVAPSLASSVGSTSFTEAANVTSTPVVIDSAITVTDPDNSTLQSATVSITDNFQSSEDVLAFANDLSTMGNISGAYNSGTGVLTLTSAGATATVSEWQAALRAVTYSNTSEEPNTADRTIIWVANDGDLGSTSVTKTVSVTATNDAPDSVLLSSALIAENQASGTTVGTVSANDPDPSDTVSFSLVSGVGSTDNDSFEIVGTSLRSTAAYNFESKSSYSIRIRATDSHTATVDQVFTITIDDVNEAPTFSGYSFNVNQDTATSILLAKILSKSSDPEGSVRTVSAVNSTSAQGGTVELLSSTIRYTPPASFSGADSFGVTLSDGALTASGTISVTVAGSTLGAGQSMVATTVSGGDVLLKFSGVPGRSYQILHTTTLPPSASWSALATVTANSSGFVLYTHVNPPSPSYWRTLLVP